VGESGCGKTTTGRCVLRLEVPTSGQVIFEGRDLATLSEAELRGVRRRMQVIFQDPYSSLNPRMTVGQIIAEPLAVHRIVPGRAARAARVQELLRHAGLLPAMARRYPHELSGGQRQRVGIARALAMEPSLIICDEPVSALDVSIQAQIINLLEELQTEFGLTYLFVAHDLSVVRHISDRVAVMYLGKIVEMTDRKSLYEDPQHPYTKALLSAVPIPDPAVEAQREHTVLGGEVPSPLNPPAGCVFHPRCPIAVAECRTVVPELREIRPGHHAACIRL
jgi:oligopeptide/dipeptide ABC transporter ATP-binding protein